MSVAAASGGSEVAQQATLSLAQRLALIPQAERIGLHDELEAIVSSGIPFSDQLCRIVFDYSVTPFEIDPKELVGRVCWPSLRFAGERGEEAHYFFLRLDNILPLFQKILKFGEEYGCREVMVETIRTASLTTYICQVPTDKYPTGDFLPVYYWRVHDLPVDTWLDHWNPEYKETGEYKERREAHRLGMHVWEFNLSCYLREKNAGNKHPHLGFLPNIAELQALLKQEKIFETGEAFPEKRGPYGLYQKPELSKVTIDVDDVHFYEADNPLVDELMRRRDNYERTLREVIREWNCVARCIAEFLISLCEYIALPFSCVCECCFYFFCNTLYCCWDNEHTRLSQPNSIRWLLQCCCRGEEEEEG